MAPAFQYRTKQHGVLAQFDFGMIADVTGHPYRVQCEQSKLTRILYEQLRNEPQFRAAVRRPGHGRDAAPDQASRLRSSAMGGPRRGPAAG